MIRIADSHAHLGYEGIYEEIDTILARAQARGVTSIINICTNALTLERGIELHKRFPWVYNAASITPHDVEKEGAGFFPLVKQAALNGKLVAIGETGLDYYYNHSPQDLQQQELIRYFHLALETNLPVVIHCRDAFADFFKILDQEYPSARGVLHCFTGTVAEAKEVLKRGWYLSLSGIVTFKKSTELQEVAKIVPLDQLLIETDTPYLAPQTHRGKRNEPSYVADTGAFIAEIKGISFEQLAEQTYINCQTLFGLK
jgi:TatD DNase family protein